MLSSWSFSICMISCIYSAPFLESDSDLDWESLSHFASNSSKPIPTGILNFPSFRDFIPCWSRILVVPGLPRPFYLSGLFRIWLTLPAGPGLIIRPILFVITLGRAHPAARPSNNILGPNIAPSLLRSPTVNSWSGLDLEEAKTFIAFWILLP